MNATRKKIFEVQFKFTIVLLFRLTSKAERLYLPGRRGGEAVPLPRQQ